MQRRSRCVHHVHVVRADAVVVERQRVKQYAPALASKDARELSDDCLRLAADFMTHEDHYVAGCICNHLPCRLDLLRFNSGFLCSECVVPRVCEGEHNRVFRSGSDVEKNLCLFTEANGNGVDEHEGCAAVPRGLANSLASQWLQLSRIAADLNDRFCITNVALR